MSANFENQQSSGVHQMKSGFESESPSMEGSSFSPPPFQLMASQGDEDENGTTQLKEGAVQKKADAPVQKKNADMPAEVQTKMETSMGADFSGVNIHKNSENATNMGALAYAQGNDVHFAPGQYNPGSQSGQELIGHELAHVVQQREGRVQPTTETNGKPVNDNKGLEAEADSMGQKAATSQLKADPTVQKKEGKSSGKNTAQAKIIQKVNNPVSQVISYIRAEMATNAASAGVSYIQGQLASARSAWTLPGRAYHTYNAYKKWYDLVKTGGPWDHKSHLSSTYGLWTDDTSMSTSYFFDTWSNIHYGFIGLACGFPQWDLLAGAGAAQVMAGTVPPGYWTRRFETLFDADVFAAFDDPKDQAAIRVGFGLWNGHGAGVTDAQISAAIRASSGSLSTRAIVAAPTGAAGAAPATSP